MWTRIKEFLKAWKTRLLAGLGSLALLVQTIEPKWVIEIFGPGSEGWVNLSLVIGLFVIHQALSNHQTDKVENA